LEPERRERLPPEALGDFPVAELLQVIARGALARRAPRIAAALALALLAAATADAGARPAGRSPLIAVLCYHDRTDQPGAPLMSWQQIQDCERQGMEIASHSHDLHHYEIDNPYRDTAPAGTLRYATTTQRYETRDEYRARVIRDLAESQRQLEAELGHRAST